MVPFSNSKRKFRLRAPRACLQRCFTCLGTLLLTCILVLAQVNNSSSPSQLSGDTAEEIVGCLSGGPTEFQLSDAEGYVYSLRGQTDALQHYVGEEISVRGTKQGDKANSPSFIVASVKEVFRAPEPKLSPAIASGANWHTHSIASYAVTFALPTIPEDNSAAGGLASNFVAERGAITLGSFILPREIYPDTNFVGGSFMLSANPEITNRESCEKFGRADVRFLSSRILGGIRYAEMTEGDAAAGTSYENYYYHSLQNGVCFEIAFQFGGYNTANQDLGCRVPVVKNELDVINAFASRVSYSHPEAGLPGSVPARSTPRVTSFMASSNTADGATNRSTIRFSWSSENADYVEFSYRCSVVGLGVTILEGGSRNCSNDLKPITPDTQQFNHSPKSSTEVIFGNSREDDPISVVVTITPFAYGKAYPSASRSLTISVAPYNPFPEGIPAPTANMRVSYSDTASSYAEGSQLTVTWSGSNPRDQCVDLYLVQEVGGVQKFVAQIVRRCLVPAAAGSYTWTIPTKYSGPGFRIYASTPGGISRALGDAFSISGANPARTR